jgi:GcrA cell cycle regulator
MHSAQSFAWTDGDIAQLKQLRAAGHSSSQIGLTLGVSRNAVIGKAARLGLPLPIDTKPRYRPASRAPRQPRAPRNLAKIFLRPSLIPVEPMPIIEPPQPPEFLAIALVDLDRNQCRYARGEGADIRFCGQPVDRGSYCGHCYRIVYVPMRPDRRKPFIQRGWDAA